MGWLVDTVRDAPPPLRAYAAVSVVAMLVPVGLGVSAALILLGVVVQVAFVILVLRGSRIAWSLIVASSAISLLIAPFTSPAWWSVAIELADLACLLLPASRSFVWRPRSDQDWKPTCDSDDYSDSDRPSGWYLHPSSFRRMRYWNADDARWLGIAKTPRKIRKAWAMTEMSDPQDLPAKD